MEGDEDGLRAAVVGLRGRWEETAELAGRHAESLRACGLQGGSGGSAAMPRLNAAAQDCLATLRSLQLRLRLLAQQLPSVEESEDCLETLEEWKRSYQTLQSSLRVANLQAKSNIQKAAQEERAQLLGGGRESTDVRRNMQTQAGMSAATESITETLRRTRQMMVQEWDRGTGTLATLDESTLTLKKAEGEYKGQRSLLMKTRHLLTMMKRHDVIDRVILVAGFVFFSVVVSYVFHQRIGTLNMLRQIYQVLPSIQDQPQVSSHISCDVSKVTPNVEIVRRKDSSRVLTYETPNTINSPPVVLDASEAMSTMKSMETKDSSLVSISDTPNVIDSPPVANSGDSLDSEQDEL